MSQPFPRRRQAIDGNAPPRLRHCVSKYGEAAFIHVSVVVCQSGRGSPQIRNPTVAVEGGAAHPSRDLPTVSGPVGNAELRIARFFRRLALAIERGEIDLDWGKITDFPRPPSALTVKRRPGR
jgi:hypothetical protein